MEKVIYKEREYSLSEYLDLLKLYPKELDGEAIISSTKEIISANDEQSIRHLYIEEYANAKKIIRENADKSNKDVLIDRLTEKYSDGTINRWEFALLLKLTKNIKLDKSTNQLFMKYDRFYILNMDTPKPKDLSYQDYGRFIDMLNYCFNYNNHLVYDNGKQIQKVDLEKVLGFTSKRTLYVFLQKLKSYRMIAETKVDNKKFLVVNPYYANKNLKITREIFIMFEEDLRNCFDDVCIEYILKEDMEYFNASIVEVM